ncbi:MAG: DUF1501 domain-containing protein [Verrucomicrobiales bacterium]|nr:DUF1501 domain-containing protein [Verrucomicrobiales bacterium]
MNMLGNGFSRRTALKTMSSGFGYLAFSGLSSMAAEQAKRGPLAVKQPHFAPRAKRVIFLCMRGGPSHVDTFDYKPQLAKDAGKPAAGGGRARQGATLMGSPFEFKQRGKSGLWISDLYSEVGKHADDLCVLNGMHTDLPNHPQAMVQMHTGNFQFVRPSMGAWALYGLGTENENLPGFITLSPPTGVGGAQNYGSAFLPAIYQGTKIGDERRLGGGQQQRRRFGAREEKEALENIRNKKLPAELQRTQLDLIKSLNMEKLERDRYHPEVEGVIESFELAFRMQDEVPKVMDTSGESKETLGLYGIGEGVSDSFGRQCLMARRFAEAGVRFIEVTHGNWDQHRNLNAALRNNSAQTDRPIAGLLADLKRRDMLKDTLVIWSGEFGRTPHGQGGESRDHNNKGYSSWMAGGGVKGGIAYGMTDEYGYEAVEDRVHTHDWHATILHLLGLDHERLTYNYAGRDFRLTDVYGNVVKRVLA